MKIRVFNPSDLKVDGRLFVDFPGRKLIKAYETSLNEERKTLIINDGWIGVEVPGKGLITVEVLLQVRDISKE